MATTLVKALASVGALGTASGVGTLVYLNTGTKISDKLTSGGFKLISDEHDYKIQLFTYKTDAKLQRAIGVTTLDHTKHVSKLKQWCNENLNQWASSDKENAIFDNAKIWCVIPTIRTWGDKFRSKLHGVGEWQSNYTKLTTNSGQNLIAALKSEFKGIDFKNSTPEGGAKLEEWCDNSLKLKIYEIKEHKTEVNIKAWCVKPS